MATHSSTLAWEIPWTEEPDTLQSMGSQNLTPLSNWACMHYNMLKPQHVLNSGSWWCSGRPGVLWFMGLQRVRHDWATELNWLPILSHLKIVLFIAQSECSRVQSSLSIAQSLFLLMCPVEQWIIPVSFQKCIFGRTLGFSSISQLSSSLSHLRFHVSNLCSVSETHWVTGMSITFPKLPRKWFTRR